MDIFAAAIPKPTGVGEEEVPGVPGLPGDADIVGVASTASPPVPTFSAELAEDCFFWPTLAGVGEENIPGVPGDAGIMGGAATASSPFPTFSAVSSSSASDPPASVFSTELAEAGVLDFFWSTLARVGEEKVPGVPSVPGDAGIVGVAATASPPFPPSSPVSSSSVSDPLAFAEVGVLGFFFWPKPIKDFFRPKPMLRPNPFSSPRTIRSDAWRMD
mmetsp:Transcript_97098/g.277852  ORF Transcript_97098/g.277852 Transcript_97098/m.277852 type:complete len:216 (-) Transcript_97098:322-969(-)